MAGIAGCEGRRRGRRRWEGRWVLGGREGREERARRKAEGERGTEAELLVGRDVFSVLLRHVAD